MRILLFLLAVAAAQAANPPPGLESKTVLPAVVVQMAEAHARTVPQLEKREAAKRAFEFTFVMGFTQPNITVGSGNDSYAQGAEAGKAYWRAHPEKLREILEGYGYVATEADGVWKAGFERSDFRSRTNPKESWWISVLHEDGAVKAGAERVQVEPSQQGVAVHVSGYLSPPGSYGHMGQGRRELFATSITAAKGK